MDVAREKLLHRTKLLLWASHGIALGQSQRLTLLRAAAASLRPLVDVLGAAAKFSSMAREALMRASDTAGQEFLAL
jgi:hypothetical protein